MCSVTCRFFVYSIRWRCLCVASHGNVLCIASDGDVLYIASDEEFSKMPYIHNGTNK